MISNKLTFIILFFFPIHSFLQTDTIYRTNFNEFDLNGFYKITLIDSENDKEIQYAGSYAEGKYQGVWVKLTLLHSAVQDSVLFFHNEEGSVYRALYHFDNFDICEERVKKIGDSTLIMIKKCYNSKSGELKEYCIYKIIIPTSEEYRFAFWNSEQTEMQTLYSETYSYFRTNGKGILVATNRVYSNNLIVKEISNYFYLTSKKQVLIARYSVNERDYFITPERAEKIIAKYSNYQP